MMRFAYSTCGRRRTINTGLPLIAAAVGLLASHAAALVKRGGIPKDVPTHPAMASAEQLVMMLHIGKTGGTMLRDVFSSAFIADKATFVKRPPGGDPHTATAAALQSCSQHPNVRFVYFVRAPLHRYTSGWISRFRQGKPFYNVPWSDDEKKAFNRFQTPSELGCALSSDDKEEAKAAKQAMMSIEHVNSSLTQYWGGRKNLAQCANAILFAGRFEHFDTDYKSLVHLLRSRGVLTDEVHIPETADKVIHATPPELAELGVLNECAIKNLREWYAEDYKLLDDMASFGLIAGDYPDEVRSLDFNDLKL